MNELASSQARAAISGWQHTIAAEWQRQSGLVAGLAGGAALAAAEPPLPPIPQNATPREIAAWWKELSPQNRQHYEDYRPEAIRDLDGIPAGVRDRTNRTWLRYEESRLRVERGELGDGDSGRLTEIDNELRGITRIKEELDQGGRYLLGFDLNGPNEDATAIIARGNPDTAANVATYVPGVQSGFVQMDDRQIGDRWDSGPLDEANALYDAAGGAGTDTSTIMWLGYDTPDSVAHGADDSYALAANESLDRFQQGLRAVNDDAHLTVVGHSYGSLTTGVAARDGGMPADDIVILGSPGAGVDTAEELGVPGEHVWVSEHKDDIVTSDGVNSLGGHGADPGDESFGAERIPASPEDMNAIDAHTSYVYETPSKEYIGHVINGTIDEYLEELERLRREHPEIH